MSNETGGGSVAIAINTEPTIVNNVVVDNGPFDITPPSFALYDHVVWRFGDLTGALTMTYTKTGMVAFSSNPQPLLEELHFPILTNVTGESALTGKLAVFDCPSLTAFTAPVLQTAGFVQLTFCPLLTSLAFPLLTDVTEADFQVGNCGLTSFSAPLLTSVAQQCQISETNIATLSLPSLTTLGGNLMGFLSPLLTTVSIPQVVFGAGVTVDFQGCALDVTSVNHILARCVASPLFGAGAQLNLSGGTNAAPAGQGAADVITLTGLGVFVQTN